MSEVLQPLKREPLITSYEGGKRIGSGGQGTVYEYRQVPNDKVYAVKIMYHNDEDYDGEDGDNIQKRNILREQSASPKFEHAHLMKAHDVFEYPQSLAIVMPYYSRGSLSGLVLDPTKLKDVIRQILMALQHLHDLGYIHRDIKPANVLVSSLEGEAIHVIVADYGLLTSENPVTFMGTAGYMAPEIIVNGNYATRLKQYDNKVDIYALGMLILQVLGLAIPKHRIVAQEEFTKRVKLLIAKQSDACGHDDFDRFDLLTVADRMLQFAAVIRPSAHACQQLPCLDTATAPPAAMFWRSPTASVATTRSGASDPAKPPTKDWWISTRNRARQRHSRVPKPRAYLPPVPPVPRYKTQKGNKSPPRFKEGHENKEEEEPEKSRKAEDAPSPVNNWEDMVVSD